MSRDGRFRVNGNRGAICLVPRRSSGAGMGLSEPSCSESEWLVRPRAHLRLSPGPCSGTPSR